MAKVTLIGPLKAVAGSGGPFDIDAPHVSALLAAIRQRFPDLAPLLDGGVAVAIDGQIHQDDWLAAIAPDSDVHILPPIAGG